MKPSWGGRAKEKFRRTVALPPSTTTDFLEGLFFVIHRSITRGRGAYFKYYSVIN